LRLPYLLVTEHEYSEHHRANLPADRILVPEVIPQERLSAAGFSLRKIVRYKAFKKEVYVSDFDLRVRLSKSLSSDEEAVLVTTRPPSMWADYQEVHYEALCRHYVATLARNARTHCLVVSRTAAERNLIAQEAMDHGRVQILSRPVNDLLLIWASDIVVRGAGTMKLESALLGVPIYSIFTGRGPYVDEHLKDLGKLKFIQPRDDIDSTPLLRRSRQAAFAATNPGLAAEVADFVPRFRKGIDC
jgi:predicted glycosyltransferase